MYVCIHDFKHNLSQKSFTKNQNIKLYVCKIIDNFFIENQITIMLQVRELVSERGHIKLSLFFQKSMTLNIIDLPLFSLIF